MKKIWIIKDTDGRFVSLRENNSGKYLVKYDGIASGFSFYEDKNVAEQKLKILTSEFDSNFLLELTDLNSIPEGKRIDNT